MLKKMALNLEKVVRPISNTLNSIGNVVLMLMMLLIVADVLLRNLINSPITGSFELIEFMMGVAIFFFFANGQIEKGNVSVDMFVNKLPAKIKAIVETFVYLVSVILFTLITVQMAKESYAIFLRNDLSPAIYLPEFPFFFAATVGVFFMAIVLFIDFLLSLAKVLGSEEICSN
ncbi:MAG: TRAP transporter small permease [Clostridia bacterium]|nr:TRAP transporter small permease [Clostridia bacterium]